MSADFKMTKGDMDFYLNELAKLLKKTYGKNFEAEIIVVGGGAIMASYSFRQMTADIDAIIQAKAQIKDEIYKVADKFNLPSDWLNSDFMRTDSYSAKLSQVSKFYKSFCNGILTVRVMDAEYLIAMKMKSFRPYKKDLSDVVGIIGEHIKLGSPINSIEIVKAYKTLYDLELSTAAKEFLDRVYATKAIDQLYSDVCVYELNNKKSLVRFVEEYPKAPIEDNLGEIMKLLQNQERQ